MHLTARWRQLLADCGLHDFKLMPSHVENVNWRMAKADI
jgi:hypothetical protein